MRSLLARLIGTFRRRDGDLEAEFESHLQHEIDAQLGAGLSPAEARRAALLKLGPAEPAKELYRDRQGLPFLETLAKDLRHGARRLRQHPVFAAVAILSLALGIGANTAIFSVVNAILLRPLPGADPDRLTALYTSDFSGPAPGANSYADFVDIRDQARDIFESITAFAPFGASYVSAGRSEVVFCELTSEEFFSALGVKLALGRGFLARETAPVTVISHEFWTSRFQRDLGVLGRTLALNGSLFTVVGVAPPKFSSPLRVLRIDAWIPHQFQALARPGETRADGRGNRGTMILARLRPGVTLPQAQARLDTLAQQFFQAYPEWANIDKQARSLTIYSEADSRVPPFARLPAIGFLGMLTAVVILLLLIACANLGNLLLAQSSARRHEMSIRLAIGGSRPRLIRQLLTESLLLSLGGGAAGILIAVFLTRALAAFRPPLPVPVRLDLALELPVLAGAALLSILAGLAMALVPALAATRPQPPSGRAPRVTWRGSLVVTQTAASVLLLVVAGLFIRSLAGAYAVPVGFDPSGVTIAEVDLQLTGYTEARGRAFFQAALERFPAAGLSESPVLSLQAQRRTRVAVAGYTPGRGEDMEYHFSTVSPGFFQFLGVPLEQGREFARGEKNHAVVNRAFARKFWPGESAVGKRVRRGDEEGTDPYLEVAGVVADARLVSFSEAALPMIFFSTEENYAPSMALHVRGVSSVQALREELLRLDPNLPLLNVMTMNQNLAAALLPMRVARDLIGAFGLLGLALAAIGIYGLLAYSVARRTREIGVRVAIGASSGAVLRAVLAQGLRLVLAGAIVGLAAAFAVTRLLASFLYGISPGDPVTFGGVALLITGVALAAAAGPARRALRINPTEALRYE